MKQTCILVLGMHRSGTSALTGTLNLLLDVYLGRELLKAQEDNVKGFYENQNILDINEKMFTEMSTYWHDMFFNGNSINKITNNSKKELQKFLLKEFEYSQLFAIKDPRLAYLFPIYSEILQKMDINIKVIIPYRNPIEVAISLSKRNGFSLEKGMLLWAYHFLLAEKFSRGYDRVFVNFDDLISNTSQVVDDLSKKLYIDFSEKFNKNKKDIEEFLEPGLKHHNISMDNLSSNIPKIVKDILVLKNSFNNKNLEKEFDVLRKELFNYQKLFYNRSIVSSLDEGQRAKQNLQSKEQELSQTKQNLQSKEQELSQTKQNLQSKEQELSQTKQNLQSKEQELSQTKQELDNLKIELTNIYMSKSWKLTRPLRRFIRIAIK
jgi:hypothetical protein